MAVDLADLTQKVHDQIAGLYAQGGPAALGILTVAFEPLGIPVPPSSFQAHPTDPAPIPVLAVRRVSTLTNQVPAIRNGTYFRTQFQIDEFYQYLLNALQPSPGAEGSSGPLFALLAQAKQLYEEGHIADVLNVADKIYPTNAEPEDWYLPGPDDSWTSFRFTSDAPRTIFDSTAGTSTLRGTFSFDFDQGAESQGGDVFWEQFTASTRALVPKGTARLADLGAANFDQLGPDQLMSAPFTTTPISGNEDATDRLQVGRVFAVFTNGGRYSKVQVLNRYQQPGGFYMLQFHWVTYVPVAAPAPAAPHRTLMLRTFNGAPPLEAAAKPQWSWTLNTAAAAPAPPVEAAPTAAPVPIARAALMREMVVSNPNFAFAQPVQVAADARTEADSLELSFELRAVTLDRPWMSLGILADRNWFVPGYRASEFGTQLLPAIPVTMLVARNVVVKAAGSPDDSPVRALGFGPFSLANRQATLLPSPPGRTAATLSAPTPQIIGWVAQPLNGIAPTGDPALAS
jgi:hypothetical protein